MSVLAIIFRLKPGITGGYISVAMLEAHLDKLRVFHVIAREGSLQGAARALRVSQPALTKALQVLEDALGSSLAIRHRRGLELTESGRALKEFCDRLMVGLPDVEKRIKAPSGISGVVSLGTYETLGVTFWPNALASLRADCPDLSVRVSTQDPTSLWERLDQGLLKIIVDAEPPIAERYYSRVLYADRFGLYVASKSPRHLPFSYVTRTPDREGVSIREHLLNRGVDHDLAYEFETFNSVLAVTQQGLAVGVLPVTLAQRYVKQGLLNDWLWKGKSLAFGEHRVCATCLEPERSDRRVKAIMAALMTAAREFAQRS